jgi:hypothetical protein
MFEVRFTADVTTPESAEFGGYDRSGWIDPDYSKTTLFDSYKDVTTYRFDAREEAETFIESTIGEADSYDGSTWYAADGHDDYVTGENWSYAAHIEEF